MDAFQRLRDFYFRCGARSGDQDLPGIKYRDRVLIRKPEVRHEMGAKDLRQQGNGIKRDGQTSPARDHRPVVG
jgi:hypothetical protein